MGLQKVGWGGMDCNKSGVVSGHVAGACECGNEPLGSIKWGGISWLDEGVIATWSMELIIY
jgi:hypothetical protein